MNNQTKPSIRTELEKQAQTRRIKVKRLKHKDTRQQKDDPLRLNWKDAVIFSLLLVFSGGYWLQAPATMF